MKRLLLLGGSGQLGTAIREGWNDMQIVAPTHAKLDIGDAPGFLAAIDATKPDIVINCAAFHDVDRCELEPLKAFAINAIAVDSLARACRTRDAIFVTISTDYVFGGESMRPYRESDPAAPISAYGASKLAGELLALRFQARTYVVRTCGVYGRADHFSKPSFIDRILESARAGETLRVAGDVIASPTYAVHLAAALRQLVESDRYGLYHAVNQGAVSWRDLAREALHSAGITARVEEPSSEGHVAGARRPRYSALENSKLSVLGIRMPDWSSGVTAYVRSLRS